MFMPLQQVGIVDTKSMCDALLFLSHWYIEVFDLERKRSFLPVADMASLP